VPANTLNNEKCQLKRDEDTPWTLLMSAMMALTCHCCCSKLLLYPYIRVLEYEYRAWVGVALKIAQGNNSTKTTS